MKKSQDNPSAQRSGTTPYNPIPSTVVPAQDPDIAKVSLSHGCPVWISGSQNHEMWKNDNCLTPLHLGWFVMQQWITGVECLALFLNFVLLFVGRGPEKCCLCLWAHSDLDLPLHPTAQVSLLDKAFSYWFPSSIIWKPRSLPTCRCPLDLSYFFSRLLSPNILQHSCAHKPLVGTVHQFSKWSQTLISPSYPQSIDDLLTFI